MDEKIIVRSERLNLKTIASIWLAVILILVLKNIRYPDACLGIIIALGTPLAILTLLVRGMSIAVTDKRVYGITYFGRSVSLPLDSISSVGSLWFKGVFVATSSGRISFILLRNARELHKAITKLLIERQENKSKAQAVQTKSQQSLAIEGLKQYKELLDAGVITQEEFDEKKKQLLNL
jgi:hypothetical protein